MSHQDDKISSRGKSNFHFSLISGFIICLFVVACASPPSEIPAPKKSVRIALFNIWEMSTVKLTDLDENGMGQDEQLIAAAQIIRDVNPDILVINEIDHDMEALERGENLTLNLHRFQNAYLKSNDYSYLYIAPCNTGFLAGKDFDNNGMVATVEDQGSRDHGGDCYGYGAYPGQYSMAILSKVPLDTENARTFQKFLWKDLPDNLIPTDWYSKDEIEIFRLSSKSHWDVPFQIDGESIHLLVSHPTPPVFDGEEDRNGRRNFDEIKMWVHYINGDSVLVDDSGIRGGLQPEDSFVILGDLNAAPLGDPVFTGQKSIDLLLKHPQVRDCADILISDGALQDRQPGPPTFIENRTTGRDNRGMRIDHILPSKDLKVLTGGVYWPGKTIDPEGNARVQKASDHRLVWIDIEVGQPTP